MREFFRTIGFGTVLAACGLWVSGCATLLGGEPLNMLSTEQEITLGNELSTEVEKQVKVLDNAAIQAYVQQIGARLTQVSPRQDVEYVFKVINDPETVNAFALPGGHMYIYTGLMRLCRNEAELASVMAHEMAHVAEHHHGESFTRQYLWENTLAVALGENPSARAQMVGDLLGTGAQMFGYTAFSRIAEREADALGMRLMLRAGYNPSAMVTFMQKMIAESEEGGEPKWFVIFRSHPPTQRRMEYLNAMAAQFPPEEVRKTVLYAGRYRQHVLNPLGADTASP